jgi:hypothetical protein
MNQKMSLMFLAKRVAPRKIDHFNNIDLLELPPLFGRTLSAGSSTGTTATAL